MSLLNKIVMSAIFAIGLALVAASHDFIALTPGQGRILWVVWLVTFGLELVLTWRTRKDLPQTEPSPAQSVSSVILATGLAGVAFTESQEPGDHAIPIVIAISSILLAIVAHRLASKHGDQIGEARFDTSSNDH